MLFLDIWIDGGVCTRWRHRDICRVAYLDAVVGASLVLSLFVRLKLIVNCDSVSVADKTLIRRYLNFEPVHGAFSSAAYQTRLMADLETLHVQKQFAEVLLGLEHNLASAFQSERFKVRLHVDTIFEVTKTR